MSQLRMVSSTKFALRHAVVGKAVRALLSYGSVGTFRRCVFERGFQLQTQAPNHQEDALFAEQGPLHLPRET